MGWLGSDPNAKTDIQDLQFQNLITAKTPMDSTIWEFMGNGFFIGQQRNFVTHDDGVTVAIPPSVGGPFVINKPGPTTTPQIDMFFLMTSGNAAFEFVYADCSPAEGMPGCTGPSVLTATGLIPFNVPEPGSLALLGSALAGIGLAIRRRCR
jgi:hypothetical protein